MKKQLIVRGFYGRGNCGDEAILQSIYEAFVDKFDICIVTDLHELNLDIVRSMYPYNETRLEHCENRSLFGERNPDKTAKNVGFLLGGGGLGSGFGFNLYVVAKRYGLKVIHAGTHIDGAFFKGIQKKNVPFSGITDVGAFSAIIDNRKEPDHIYNNQMKGILEMADYTAVRNSTSIDICKKVGVEGVNFRQDWAFGLKANNTESLKDDARRMLVTVREYNSKFSNPHGLRVWEKKIIEYAKKLGMYIKYVPYCKEDMEFLRRSGIDFEGKVLDNIYWNPKEMKEYVKKSGMVVSLGRFHPLIFAISEGTPLISIDYNFEDYYNKGAVLLNDCRLGEFRFDKKDEDKDCYDTFKKAVSDRSRATLASIGKTNKYIVTKMRDEILTILTNKK